MFHRSMLQSCSWPHLILASAITVFVAALTVNPAFGDGAVIQIEDFYWPSGTQVLSEDGMPFAHGVLIRSFGKPTANGVTWDVMTVGLTPGVWYDIWLEGSNDGTAQGAFAWWLKSARATGQGDLDKAGHVFTGRPPGAHTGTFTNVRAELYLVIRTAGGVKVQSALFPEL